MFCAEYVAHGGRRSHHRIRGHDDDPRHDGGRRHRWAATTEPMSRSVIMSMLSYVFRSLFAYQAVQIVVLWVVGGRIIRRSHSRPPPDRATPRHYQQQQQQQHPRENRHPSQLRRGRHRWKEGRNEKNRSFLVIFNNTRRVLVRHPYFRSRRLLSSSSFPFYVVSFFSGELLAPSQKLFLREY